MPVEANDPRLKFVPIDQLTTPPPGLIEHLKDRFWIVHPDKGAVFWNADKKGRDLSPQCNSNKDCAEAVFIKMYPWAEIKFIPSAFRRINPQDYC